MNPPFFVGPLAPGWAVQQPSFSALSTDYFLYNLLRPAGPLQTAAGTIDVRDVARALVLSLHAPPTAKVGKKRFLLSGEWYGDRKAVDYLAEVRPELKPRLSEAAKTADPVPKSNIDTSRAEELLGIKFTDWHKTVLEGVDNLLILEKEKEWKSQHVVN